ncbi:MAG TPA: response regulator [Ktedonobacterales bacterium]|nr:response regulator [Ktedonobacterales bacterium]
MPLRVCVVEDDPDIRDALHLLFEEAEATIEEAADGEAALNLLHAQAASRVLLLDRAMPRLDGVGVLRVLAQEPALQRRTAVLFMTARHEPLDAQLSALLTTLGVETITKPFDVDVLFISVERAWQRLIDTL